MFEGDAALVTLQVITLVVMLVGLFGLMIPVLPGLVIIWVAALVYGILTGFGWGGAVLFGLITVLMIAGNLVDNVIMGARAREQGASWLAIGVAMVLGVVGSFVFPPFGGLIAALLGLFVVEVLRLRSLKKAFDSTRSMAIGCGWAAVIRFGIGTIMIMLWAAWVLWA
jgi:uncharacterized protein